MSTFYLLPPRPLLGERFAEHLQLLFPGLLWNSASWSGLADLLATAAASLPDVFVVHREDLPDGEPLPQALIHGYGAEAGDEIIEVRLGIRPGEVSTRRWLLDHDAAEGRLPLAVVSG